MGQLAAVVCAMTTVSADAYPEPGDTTRISARLDLSPATMASSCAPSVELVTVTAGAAENRLRCQSHARDGAGGVHYQEAAAATRSGSPAFWLV